MRRDLSGAFDAERLEAYCGGQRAIVCEVLSLFREQAQMWMRLLEDPSSGSGFVDAAHTLKGAAAGVFAEGLARACGEAEAQGGAAAGGEREVLAAHIRDALDPVLFDVAAYLHAEAIAALRA